ncbi:S66 family peptidase [Nocardioides lianchengensis]|uniref:Muramoyltetrapeptide carboxypeptidase LdcA (Peptidoglycan recycling) n=1 Tax=Nocardioides lianchengensis TaxID=1045774 RepID=A0A1G6NQZ8_9ACTN|nr:S66 peptidase family protein [Nocardioides lianchengensis]NYG10854.1 muramoyltetrapeptide carboxypeptidase LdcA involved in peptidoglycan recycling [Nocardioides lianchengensis]SDC70101.1 Muramoyltetrapeptide carboxypeptidase LdcA (peptidoglycan recycling) [Nocardioides lianchengensis]
MRFPRPLRPGDTIGVTAPSSGVDERLRPRLDAGIRRLRERGFEVEVGECLGGDGVVSAPKERRAAELTRMLTDPAVRAVVPPWGGETAIDLLDQIDWFALEAAEPTWLVGFSDLSTLMLPLSLRTGWATLHGSNLMDTAYDAPDGLLHWLDVASATEPFTQRSPGRYRDQGWDDYVGDPGVATMTLDREGGWWSLDGAPVDVSGRLVGGCLETVCHLAGTPYGDVAAYGRAHADEGLLVYLEAAEHGAYDVCRALHGLRLAGWFEHASAVVIGRTRASDADGMTQAEAVADALGSLGVPVVLDVECGHAQPFLPLVNGALAHLVLDGERREITQRLS